MKKIGLILGFLLVSVLSFGQAQFVNAIDSIPNHAHKVAVGLGKGLGYTYDSSIKTDKDGRFVEFIAIAGQYSEVHGGRYDEIYSFMLPKNSTALKIMLYNTGRDTTLITLEEIYAIIDSKKLNRFNYKITRSPLSSRDYLVLLYIE